MTRRKKTRTGGPLAPRKQPKMPGSQSSALELGKKKGKGKASGSRHSAGKSQQSVSAEKTIQDQRKGSKKPISLMPTNNAIKSDELTPERELQALENDQRLQMLLQRIEDEQTLTSAEQAYVDEKAERYEQLAAQLGIELDDDDWDDEE
ncbi:Der GTPase-activating protein YihI [Idiomarina xiamenensis]|uniref:Der GTPase activator n=1 Tax=Idiomarina xiamenensis 10-D-4 TaxID=740709 RepID=K2KA38_9GAMM|nr:Der GTPase-activating protein YihI [Idiomarina xiamenensis]EKE83397.1 Der GTPase activator [Idiomarina xiamenensis 10-D-4]